ncbi:DUF3348 family protein [Congregibacter variabilis]|uniref:DUF3348 family protein n=1 Tax=Congregibacter variabilis TaxID=3081200 RepID=A0ABZ0I637_9GAMM|nr:DUF3348 family protein [Congregibacter sp. IMCC43200]
MSKATSSSLGQAPLVRRLTDLDLVSSLPSKRVFANRLADLIDISHAITLSDFFTTLDSVRACPEPANTDASDSLFDQHRAAIRASIDASFMTQEDEPIIAGKKAFRLPAASDNTLNAPEAAVSYERFYSLHQSELERRVAQLRKALLAQLQCKSDALAQVAAIEVALGPIFVKYSRRCLATLPKLVAKRFEHLRLHQHQQDWVAGEPKLWLQEGGWLARFHDELQQLLHAELTLRLQPLQGMLSCLTSEDPIRENP